jgi:hypothetical protein
VVRKNPRKDNLLNLGGTVLGRGVFATQRIRVQAFELVCHVCEVEFLELNLRALQRIERRGSEVLGSDFPGRKRLPQAGVSGLDRCTANVGHDAPPVRCHAAAGTPLDESHVIRMRPLSRVSRVSSRLNSVDPRMQGVLPEADTTIDALLEAAMDRNGTSQPRTNGRAGNTRQDVRLAAPADLQCTLRRASAVFVMNNISTGGFGASVNMPLGRDTVYEFEFRFQDMCVVRRARVIHCAWVDGDRWNVGAAFEPALGEPTIEQLIARITATTLNVD